MRLLYNNTVYDATLVASSNQLGYGASLLADKTPFSKWKATGNVEEYVVIDLQSAKAISGFALFNHNFTSSATITLEANTSNSWGAPAFTKTLTWSTYYVWTYFVEQTYRYWRIVIEDAGNANDIEVGELYIGTDLALPLLAPDSTFTMGTTSYRNVARSSQVLGTLQYANRLYSFNLVYLSNAQRESLRDMFATHGNVEPVVLVIWEDLLDNEPPLYGVVDSESLSFARRANRAQYWNVSMSFREVV
jgi:hypothetical protein